MRLGIIIHIGILLIFISIALSQESPPAPSTPKKLICYFSADLHNKGNFTPELIEPGLCTHINYNFAILNEDTNEIDFGDKALDIDENLYGRTIALKDKNPDLKVLLSLGGWDDSTKKYSDLIADSNRRAHFVSTVVPYLKKYGFDGLDVAWEYPNCWQGDCGVNPDDVGNFVLFLTDLRNAFNPDSLLLSASVSAVREEIDEAYDVPNISKQLDHINVMSYDFHGGWEKSTGHHSQFFRHPDDIKTSLNLNSSINHWIYRGVEPSKIVIGIPSYGRSFTLVDKKKNGLNAAALGPGRAASQSNEAGLLAFSEVCENLESWSFFDDDNIGTYGVKGDQWVGFDTPKVAVLKSRFILHRGLAGASYKNFYTDDYKGTCFGTPFPILKSIKYGLNSGEEKDFEASESDIRVFVQKIQLSILVEDNRGEVNSEEKNTGASEDDVFLKLTETEYDTDGDLEIKEIEVNAGTLDATGDKDGKTLLHMHMAYN